MLFVFDGGQIDGDELQDLAADGREIKELRFHADTELFTLMPARPARRLALAVRAVQEGVTIYAEHGHAYGRTPATDSL